MRTIHKRYRDPQRGLPAAECFCCGGELYRGEVCWRLAGRTLCEDCIGPWLLDELASCRVYLREVRR